MSEPIEGDGGDSGEGSEEGMDEEDEEALGGLDPAMMQQMVAMLATMGPEQRAAMAAQFGMDPAALAALTAGLGAGAPAGSGAPAAPPPGATVVALNAEEAAAVQRLCGMGFPKQRVLEAYLACDKNEELAVNYLLNNAD